MTFDFRKAVLGGYTMVLRYILAWFPMIFIAILNGTIRDIGYKKYLGDLRAHQVSTLTGILLFGVYIWALINFWNLESPEEALTIGLIWLGLTVAFEFIFGHYVMGNPWNKLLSDYNILKGRVWILIPIWIFIAPFLFYSFL
ncbi:hypothetical protein G7B40_030160 [Aetokthonos hydrillicola Thurmond2011]|uniref:Uncharacterized protein n=2 Tax=Aetokthonos TaxID=1550243 RepID=A0AAP5M851_9CYAN|nr:hypothetical protein [Aetokthonos hydrillicola CCALA 1050]MDR9898791.1 hypothetical protein [Aetokthonos hydrillicola Thurmond2011]